MCFFNVLSKACSSNGLICLLLSLSGGAMLRSLVDILLSNLRRVQRKSTESSQKKKSRAQGQLHDWRLQAASRIVVMSEVLYGASPAWQPEQMPAAEGKAQSTASREQDASGGADGGQFSASTRTELEALVILVEEEWVKEALWGVPTSNEVRWQGDSAQAQQLTPQAGTL